MSDLGRNAPSAVFHRSLQHTPTAVVGGEGVYLIDARGKKYLDASGGAAVSCLGHSHPGVRQAIRDQLDQLAYAHNLFFTSEAAERLARRLIDRAPDGFGQGRVSFVGSGSEAMEAALKLARQHFAEKGEMERTRFISRRMSYHGNTLGALAVGGHAGRRSVYQPMLMTTTQISPCYAYRNQGDDESDEAYGLRAADELEAAIQTLGPKTVAAFIAEPVVGATLGSVPPVQGYFRRIREICDRHGVLFIADEVMCGMGRCGAWFTIGMEGVTPDIITVAKGLGAGYQPIAATIASEKTVAPILEGSGALAHGHTYMAHSLACAGANAVLDAMEEENLLDNIVASGALLEDKLRRRFGAHPNVGDIRGRGLLWSLELVRDRKTKAPFAAEHGLASRIRARAQEIGLICYPSSGTADGRNGDHVLLAPPFIINAQQIDDIVSLLDQALGDTLAALPMAA